jgi:hypothetical protein
MKKEQEIVEVVETGDKAPPMRMRTLQPPHPGTSFTIEEAMAALIKVEAEEKARRASKRKRARSTVKPGPENEKSTDHGKGDDGS